MHVKKGGGEPASAITGYSIFCLLLDYPSLWLTLAAKECSISWPRSILLFSFFVAYQQTISLNSSINRFPHFYHFLGVPGKHLARTQDFYSRYDAFFHDVNDDSIRQLDAFPLFALELDIQDVSLSVIPRLHTLYLKVNILRNWSTCQ